MRLRHSWILLLLIVTLLTLACGAQASGTEQGGLTYQDFTAGDKVFAVQIGDIYEAFVQTEGWCAAPMLFKGFTEVAEAVRLGRADVAMMTEDAASTLSRSEEYRDFVFLTVPAEVLSVNSAPVFHTAELAEKFNVFLAQLQADGILDEMNARYLNGLPDDEDIPKIELTGENGTLVVADTGDYVPMSYVGADGELLGYDTELARRFAQHLGMKLEVKLMSYDGVLPSVISGNVDMSACYYIITPEREASAIFSDPVTRMHGVLAALKPDLVSAGDANGQKPQGIVQWLKAAVERNLLTDNRWKMIVDGLGVTMTIAFLAQIGGTILGCFICWVLMRRSRFVRGLGNVYCALIHGLPIVVLLMISYYVIFGSTKTPAVLIAVIAFAFVEGAGVAGNLKRAIDAVDAVEIEAARSMGFTAFGAFRAVTLPQAVRLALPAYCDGFVNLVKATAIVGYISIQDMTRAADIIRSRTYDAYFPLLLVAVIYLIVTTICVQLFKLLIGKLNKEVRA